MTTDGGDLLLTPDELAALLRVSVRTVRRWIYERKIESIRVGGLVRIRQSVVDRWLSERTREETMA